MSIPFNLRIIYYDNGKVYELYEYQVVPEATQRHGIYVSWYESGQLRISTNYVNGERHGVYTGYHSNGNLAEISDWHHGQLHGQCNTWHSIGIKWEECQYIYGRRNGLYIGWRLNTTPAWILYYRNGRDVTLLVENIVKDIANITPAEATQLALVLGYD